MIRLAPIPARLCGSGLGQTGEPAPIPQVEPLPHSIGAGPACRINAALFAIDQDILPTIADSGALPPEDQAQMPPATTTEQIFWVRRVQVRMNGPAFLGILVTEDTCCPGASHGFTQITPLL